MYTLWIVVIILCKVNTSCLEGRNVPWCFLSPQSRRGAIKLKGGRCSAAEAHNVPRDCKFGFVVHAPEPINKRS